MATIKRSVIGQPATLTTSTKQTVITTLTAKKPLKSDTVVKKGPIAATKTTYPAVKISSKPVVSKMASTKVCAPSDDKCTASPKSAVPKSNAAAVTSSLKPVVTKTPVKRAIADSTSSDTAAKPLVKKLPAPTGVARSTAKITTRPVTSSDSKLKTTSNLLETKTATAMRANIKPAVSTGKSLAKPSVEAKLPAKAKVSSPTSLVKAKPINSILASKANLATSTKPTITTSTLVTRTLAPKVDIKKLAPLARKTPATTKTASKPVSAVKPPSIRTPITPKKVIKKCTEVEICDADSTSLTVNDQMEMDTDFGSVAPSKETESLEFNEMQAYKVAEQMMEVLGTAVVTNETLEQDRLLENSVVIDMGALRVDSQTSVQMAEELASVPEEVQREKTISAECEPAENTGNHLSKDVESCPDLITFGDSAEMICDETQGTSVEGAETTAEDGIAEEASVECTDDRDEEIEASEETENALANEEIPTDDDLAVTDQTNEPLEETISDEKSTESIEDCGELDESAAGEKITSEVGNSENQDENDILDDDMVEESSVNIQLHSHSAELETGVTYDETEITCNDETVDAEMENNQCEITSENKVEGKIVVDYDSCSTNAEVSDENIETEEQNEITNERPSTIDAEIYSEIVASAADDNSQPEQPEETFEEVVDTSTKMKIQEDYFGETPVSRSVNSDDPCNGDDFVVIRLDDENDDEELEQCALIANDCLIAAEKCADTESVGSLDSVASYADVVKQSTVECAANCEAIESVEPLEDSEVCENEEMSEETVADAGEFPAVAKVDEEEVADAEVAEDAEGAESAEVVGDAENAESAEAVGDAENAESAEAVGDAEDAETDLVEMQTVKVESLLGSITDEVQNELDAGMEHSHAVDEEGYEKVQKKRNKRQNKRNRKSLKALRKESIEGEPLIEGQESQGDNSQVFQKRKNFRKSKNSMKKQYRRYSEPYTVSDCYTTPVWRSFYAEN